MLLNSNIKGIREIRMKISTGGWKMVGFLILFGAVVCVGCMSSGGSEEDADYVLCIEPGEEWIHRFSALIKNPPQIAAWIEDEEGNYLESIYVTKKAAKEGWLANKGNRRVEALPRWAHQRNITDSAGILMPSKKQPLADGVSGATPKNVVEIPFEAPSGTERFRLVLEINHSTDFNAAWPEDARKGDANWSGGSEGSGQPSLVYSALIGGGKSGPWELSLDGHGSPDGSDGGIDPDVSSFTSAVKILKRAEVAAP